MSIWDIALIIYGFFAVSVVVRLVRNGSRTLDDELTTIDRRLIGSATFYAVLPLTVVFNAVGLELLGRSFGIPMSDGNIDPAEALKAAETWQVIVASAAGPVLGITIALVCLATVMLMPRNAAWNLLRLEVARNFAVLNLFLFPIAATLLQEGNFWLLRVSLARIAFWLGDLVLLAIIIVPLFLWWRFRTPLRLKYLWLATPLFDKLREARTGTEQAPMNPESWNRLASVYLSGQEATKAMKPLKRALELDPERADTHFLMGMACLQTQDAQEASEHLRYAGQSLQEQSSKGASAEERELYHEVLLGLAAARLALGDPSAAYETAEEARQEKPFDIRGIIVSADALLAAGKLEEAKTRLEQGLRRADGLLALEIEKRLRSLS